MSKNCLTELDFEDFRSIFVKGNLWEQYYWGNIHCGSLSQEKKGISVDLNYEQKLIIKFLC